MSELSDFIKAGSGGGKTLKHEEFTSSQTWTRPAGVDLVFYQKIGGGAAGATRNNIGYYKSSGGAAGQLSEGYLNVTSDLTLVIGAGGVHSTSANAYGGDGGNTTITGTGISITSYGGMGNGDGSPAFGQNISPIKPTSSDGAGGAPSCCENGESAKNDSSNGFTVGNQYNINRTITGFVGGAHAGAVYYPHSGISGYGKDGLGDGGHTGRLPFGGENGGLSGYDAHGGDGVANTGSGGGGTYSSSAIVYYGGDGADGVIRLWWWE